MPIPLSSGRPPGRALLRVRALDRLTEAIVDGTLEPGERLRDQDLSEWLQVSRTPIREAIARLSEIGLIELEPNRYTRVTDLDPEAINETCRALGTIVAGALLRQPELWVSSVEAAGVKHLLTGRAALSHFWRLTDHLIATVRSEPLQTAVDAYRPVISRASTLCMDESDIDRYQLLLASAVESADPTRAARTYQGLLESLIGERIRPK
ncbi:MULTISPECIES: GntR family transcriptional regulator [Mycetocola]|uniref:GntR family transcriptional regulator n=1 Tax=Mycetocola TaxID=76634 RepID=UPI0006893E71|nr:MULTISPECIES: GntR family transcriptional regulator [Mycetocola]